MGGGVSKAELMAAQKLAADEALLKEQAQDELGRVKSLLEAAQNRISHDQQDANQAEAAARDAAARAEAAARLESSRVEELRAELDGERHKRLRLEEEVHAKAAPIQDAVSR